MRNWLCIVTLMAACAADSRGAGVPFILPWDDALPGVATDFSGMNTPIDGEARVSADASGHFAARGQRVRFIGVNFAGDSPFIIQTADNFRQRLAISKRHDSSFRLRRGRGRRIVGPRAATEPRVLRVGTEAVKRGRL